MCHVAQTFVLIKSTQENTLHIKLLISYDYDELDFHDQLSFETRLVKTILVNYGRGNFTHNSDRATFRRIDKKQ